MSIFFDTYNYIFRKKLTGAIYLLILLALFTIPENKAFAQFKFVVKGTVSKDERKLEGAIVALYKGKTLVQQTSTSSGGKFSFNLEPNAQYTVSITKPGHVTKTVSYSTMSISEENAKNFNGSSDLEVEIFEMPKDKSLASQIEAILSKPVGRLYYDPVKDDIINDEAYAASIQSALANLKKLEDEAKKKAEEDEAKYKAAIAKGDASFAKKDYPTAKTAYQEASAIKTFEQYPKDKLAEIDRLLADAAKQGEQEAKYKAAIAKGDAAFAAKDYANAKAAYTDASGIKPAEKYPKDKLAEIDKILADLSKAGELDAKYKAAVAKGDGDFSSKDYANAKAAYTEASGIKPSEKYPKDKIAEIDKILADIAAKEKNDKELNEKYAAAIAKATMAFSGKKYEEAKTSYNAALALKPNEQMPKDKIAEIDAILAKELGEKQLEENYKAAIAKGDAAFTKKDYPTAKTAYTDALALKPNEQYPKDKLAEIEKAMAAAASDAERLAKEKELNEKYNAAIASGDKAFKAKDYATAKAAYTDATGLKPAEKYPKDKLAEIDALIAKEMGEKELNDKYAAAIAKADAAFSTQDYTAAKAAYNDALGLKPAEKYPKDKIAEIDKILADKAAKEKAEKEANEKYAAAIAKADKEMADRKYSDAKSDYNVALIFKPNDQYSKDKIAEIDAILAKELGDKQLEESYKAAIAKGDAALAKKDYPNAKTAYTDALGLKPNEQYPKDKLAEIEKAMADAAAEADRLAKEKELNDKYNAAITAGDAALKTKDYTAAKTAYTDALGLKPAEKYPKDKIAEIDALIAKEMGEKELNDKYTAAIAKADAAFGTQDYTSAKAGYNEALGFKPSEKYPKDKIAEIDKILADKEAKEKAEKEANEKYAAAIAKADKELADKKYGDAKSDYNAALAIKPAEQYPKDKIAEIDAIMAKELSDKQLEESYKAAIAKGDAALSKKDYLPAKAAYTDALGLKPNEQYPKDKLAEIEKALADAASEADRLAKEKELNDKYNAAIVAGDAALKSKDYTAAKTAYNDALGLKPAEKYPKDKLAEIDALIAKEMGEKELNDKYTAAIAKADAAFGTQDYTSAKSGYNEALGFKSAEQYPKDKLAEIDKILADKAAKAAADKAAAEKYAALVAKADKELADKKYGDAKSDYKLALNFKPDEQYPKDKIAEIDAILASDAAAKELEEKYKAAIARADAALGSKDYSNAKTYYNDALSLKPNEQYPKDKIAAIDAILGAEQSAKELEEKYKAAIGRGNSGYDTKNYETARTAFVEASGLKPNEKYPKDKIAEIDKLIGDSNRAKALKEKYDAAIAKGDAAFDSKDYDKSLLAFQEAISLKADEPYPINKISELKRLIDEQNRIKGREKQYNDIIAAADKLLAAKEYKKAKESYQNALLIKPVEKYPKDKIDEINAILKAKNADVITPVANKSSYKNEWAEKYPEGITEELLTENNAKVVRRIVVKGNEGHCYVKKTTSFGPIYFFKDGSPITENIFIKETEPAN